MSITIDKKAYEGLIKEDLDWLLQQPRNLERDHIEAVLRQSTSFIYDRQEWENQEFEKKKAEFIRKACEWLGNEKWIDAFRKEMERQL